MLEDLALLHALLEILFATTVGMDDEARTDDEAGMDDEE